MLAVIVSYFLERLLSNFERDQLRTKAMSFYVCNGCLSLIVVVNVLIFSANTQLFDLTRLPVAIAAHV